MKDTAPIGMGIAAVAALFGVIGGLVSYVAWDFGFIGALFVAIFLALIVAIILWFGWRPANANTRDMHAEAHRSGEAPTVPAAGHGGMGIGAGSGSGASTGAAAAGVAGAGAAAGGADADAAAAQAKADADAAAAKAKAEADAAAAAQAKADAEAAARAKADAEMGAAASGGSSKVKSGTLLPGEQELSERKGEWKYEPSASADAGGEDYDGDGVQEGTNEGSKPATLTAAREGGPDDLKQIKGVGPKMENMLHGMGFFHFDQVAAWTSDEVAWVDANLEGFKGRVSRDNWVEQAKVLAAGGETEFSKRVEEGDVYD